MTGVGETILGCAAGDGFVVLPVAGSDQRRRGSWGEMIVEAGRTGDRLCSFTKPGKQLVVGVLAGNSWEYVRAVVGTWMVDACLVPFPLPNPRADNTGFVAETLDKLVLGDVDVFVVDPDFEPFIPVDLVHATGARVVTFTELESAPVGTIQVAGDLAVLQFTSGSTSTPKGVEVTYGMLETNLAAITVGVGHQPGDVMVSWLPMFHDMGLFGGVAWPLFTGSSLVLSTPQKFVMSPRTWMEDISVYHGNITAAPNFAYAIAARVMRSMTRWMVDLDSLRVAINGAEPVDVTATHDWLEAGKRLGLKPGVAMPAFGMAESCLAVTFSPLGRGLATRTVSLESISKGTPAPPDHYEEPQTTHVLLGAPLTGTNVTITDPVTGELLENGQIGEVIIDGPAVTRRYRSLDSETNDAFRDGALRTGDLGYFVDGELVICGRIKDMLVIGGRNFFPNDIELVTGTVPGVRAGNVIVFPLNIYDLDIEKETFVIAAETKIVDPTELKQLATKIRTVVTAQCGITPGYIQLLPVGEIPKTTSGKLQRNKYKQAWLTRHAPRIGELTNAR